MASKYKKQKTGYYVAAVWDGTYNKDGSRHRKYLTSTKSSKDLEKRVRDFERAVEERTAVVQSRITFLQYARKWRDVYKAGLSQNTLAMYDNIIDKYISVESSVQLSDFRPVHALSILSAADGKKRTQQQITMTIKQIVTQAVSDHYLPASVSTDVARCLPAVKYRAAEKRALTANEKLAVFGAVLSPMDQCFLYLIYGCGLRREEALALTKFDFDWKNGEVSIVKARALVNNSADNKDTKSVNGMRRVPLPERIRPTVEEYVRNLPGPYLFTLKRTGEQMTKSSYDKMWRRIIKAMQAVTSDDLTGLTAHVFRHNYCTELCGQIPAISIKHIARLMGDSEQVVMKVYSHINLEKEDAHAAVNAALG